MTELIHTKKSFGRKTNDSFFSFLKLFFVIVFLVVFCSLDGRSQSVFINEIHYDNVGADSGEGIEIAGPSNTLLNGYLVQFYNGATGFPYGNVLQLSGILNNQQNGFGVKFFFFPGIQNGAPDGMALIDDQSNVIQFISYEGTITATGGFANGLTSTDIGRAENESPFGFSLQLTGSGNQYTDFTWTLARNTYNSINFPVGQTFTISDIDGDGTPDFADSDDDNDGVPDNEDIDPTDPSICGDSDGDTCDDCSVGTDGFGPLADNDPFNDGPDIDGNGICDSGDVEVCDSIDNDGDGEIDEGLSDLDGDGVCDGLDGCPLDINKTSPGDCGCGVPDSDADGDEVVDCEDCDSSNPSIGGPTAWYQDLDGDGFGNASVSQLSCTQPDGYVADETDCDDMEPAAYPGNMEVLDGIDNDCDGTVDNLACQVPDGLMASSVTNTSALLSWNNINPGEEYDLEYQPVGGSWTLVSGIDASQYLLDNLLNPGTRYKYRVRGQCEIDGQPITTEFSIAAQFETTIDGCDIPTGLSATPIGNTSANITWTGSTSDNYILEYRNQDLAAQPWISVDVNMATSHLLDNVLLAGTQYKYRVTRECVLENNVTVLTDTSAPMFFTTGAAGCDVPTGLMAVIVNNTSATISWSGSTADNYLLEYRNQDLPGQPWVGVNVNMATSTLLNNVLNPGTRYKYRVSRECDLSGTIVNTPPSAASFFTTSTSGCDIPTNPATPVIGDTDVTITWDEVNTGVPGEAYLLEYRIASGGSWQQMAISGGTENLMGLMEGTRYKYRIFGQCELEMGVTVTTDPSAIGVFETTVSKELSDAPSLVEALTQGEEGTALKLLTYPNPSAGMVTLSFVPNETGTGRVSIYSLNGSKVYDREFEDRLEELIDLSTNGKGMYLVRLAFNGQAFENRVVIN